MKKYSKKYLNKENKINIEVKKPKQKIKHQTKWHTKQQGIVLVITLIMVFVLAGLAIIVSSIPTNDQRIAGNSRDLMLAQQAANAAIVEAKQLLAKTWINNQALNTTPLPAPCGKPVNANAVKFDNYVTQNLGWWSGFGCQGSNYPAGLAAKPIYIVKYNGADANTHKDIYHIIARGVGINSSTVAYADVMVSGPARIGGAVPAGTPGSRVITYATPNGGGVAARTAIMATNSFVGGGGWGGVWNSWCISGVPSYGGCNRDASGMVQVWGYSGNDSPPCRYRIGQWVQPGNPGAPSAISLPSGSGGQLITCY